MTTAITFCKTDKPSELISVVEQRLPTSCFIYNQLRFWEKASDDIEIYSLGSGANTWILTKFFREDWGFVISISAPNQPEISQDIRECFLSTGIIDWHKPFLFCKDTSPNLLLTYWSKISESPPAKMEIKRLDTNTGTLFISDNWKYSHGPKTYSMVRKSIERFPSGGLYDTDGNLVTGAITPAFGLISMLHTDPSHRRKGYASHVMRYIFKELAQEGLYPCLTSEICNQTAVKFQQSLGLQQVAQVNFIGDGASH